MAYTDSDRLYYYPGIIRKVTTGFMSLFTDFRIAKYDKDNIILNYRQVPITFGSKQKFLVERKDYSLQDFNLTLPRLAVLITGMKPNIQKNTGPEILPIFKPTVSSTQINEIYRPIAYTLEFTVSILSLHLSEITQIVEQILPFYSPYKNITIQEFDMIPSYTRDLKILLTGIAPNFMEIDNTPESDIRKFNWDLTFSIDCFLYKPILVSNIIKTVKIDLLDTSTSSPLSGGLVTGYTYAVSGDSIDSYTILSNLWDDN